MSLRLLPQGYLDRRIAQAVARAIISIERVTGAIEEYDIGREDAEQLGSAMEELWSILESNGYTIDGKNNRLRRVPP